MGSEPGPGTSRYQRRLGETAVTGGVLAQEEPEAGDGGGRERRDCSEPSRQMTGGPGLPHMHVLPHPFFPWWPLCSLLGRHSRRLVNQWARGRRC